LAVSNARAQSDAAVKPEAPLKRQAVDSIEASEARSARRVVLLGASNLSQGIATVVQTAQNVQQQPVEVLAAAGFGRSYGMDSCVLGRTLPGIIHCGLWERLGQAQAPTAALITDIGNDILYGVEVPQIVEWVDTVVGRLQMTQAKICLTLLPPVEPAGLSPRRFFFFRTIFFPGCRLTRDEVLSRATLLHQRLQQLCADRGVRFKEQNRAWYGLDPIHIRHRDRRHAWREILLQWSDESTKEVPLARRSLSRWVHLQTRRPHRRTLFGWQQRAAQPSVTWRDGTTVSFY
jgi:hypothetical protein